MIFLTRLISINSRGTLINIFLIKSINTSSFKFNFLFSLYDINKLSNGNLDTQLQIKSKTHVDIKIYEGI